MGDKLKNDNDNINPHQKTKLSEWKVTENADASTNYAVACIETLSLANVSHNFTGMVRG